MRVSHFDFAELKNEAAKVLKMLKMVFEQLNTVLIQVLGPQHIAIFCISIGTAEVPYGADVTNFALC